LTGNKEYKIKEVNMTSKERGKFIRLLLNYQTKRIESLIRMYFGIDTDKKSIEEIGNDWGVSTRQIRNRLNKGLVRIRHMIIYEKKMFPSEEMKDDREKCKQLKEYVKGINPDLLHKEPPYHYSKYLDEFMLCLIDGVEN